MLGLFQRGVKSAPGPVTQPPRPKAAAAQRILHSLLAQGDAQGHFSGALGDSLPNMTTEDGIVVLCDPGLQIGITVAPTAFGIEVAQFDTDEMTGIVAAALAPLPRPEWTPEPGLDPGLTALARLPSGPGLRLTCLPCPVDPCFNTQRHPGTRLIGHLQRD